MYSEQLREKLKGLDYHITSFNELRVESAYQDVLNTFSLYTELRMQIEGNNVYDLLVAGEIEQANYTQFRHSQIVSLMKSLISFVDVFANIYLQEISPDKKKPYRTQELIKDFYKSALNNNIKLSQDVILPIYCNVIYRNKIIIHHDVKRTTATSLDKIIPFQFDLSFFDDEKKEALEDLKEQYKETIPSLKDENAIVRMLNKLFYNVPIFDDNGEENPDRKEINKLIETGGCESVPPKKLMESLDLFIDEVINTVNGKQQV
ncbi:hypothetical protein [Bacillus gobiensis]|uniref:hypothetical protein n=1 Tax=Bacillus gobiensis TaxID=1441095 RepID=UPI003D19D1EE